LNNIGQRLLSIRQEKFLSHTRIWFFRALGWEARRIVFSGRTFYPKERTKKKNKKQKKEKGSEKEKRKINKKKK